MGRQHQGTDRSGVRQVPEGSGEQGKKEETGCKITCGAPTTVAVEGLVMMMMMSSTTVACDCNDRRARLFPLNPFSFSSFYELL